jgi:uridine phosphorylase
VLGKEVFRPATFDIELCRQLFKVSEELGFPTVVGKTMTADDFYEGQGRLDGAICDYSEKDKMDFLQRAHEAGVRNIEMESLTFGAFTRHIGVRAATICAVLLNRLKGDQVVSTVEQLGQYESRVTAAVLALVRNSLLKADSNGRYSTGGGGSLFE